MKKARTIGRSGSDKEIEQVSDTVTDLGVYKIYKLTTAITSTSTDVPSGAADYDIAQTSHATGRGLLFYALSGKWIALTNTTAVPVKATGAEVNTGTDDAKFVTAKSLADSDYLKPTAAAFIADPSGAVADQDNEARTAIEAILDALIANGIVAAE